MISIPASFDLPQTLDCGQAFRWHEAEDGNGTLWWEGAAGNRFLRLRREGNSLVLSCSQEEFHSFWHTYFDLDGEYEKKRARLSSMSPALQEAVNFAPGIHILRQDPWEALCSFLISQNNNISRIKKIIDVLCSLWGTPIAGCGLHGFPAPETLASLEPEDLAPLRAGYRAKYLIDAARRVSQGKIDFEEIKNSPVEFGRRELQNIAGVGPKVAECVLLYGFHKTECFPMDVWMKRAMTTLLPGFIPADFGKDAGFAQQIIFHYSRMHPELFTQSRPTA